MQITSTIPNWGKLSTFALQNKVSKEMHFSQASDGPSAASLTIVFSLLICERDMCTWAWVPAEVGVPDSPAAAVTGSYELPDMVACCEIRRCSWTLSCLSSLTTVIVRLKTRHPSCFFHIPSCIVEHPSHASVFFLSVPVLVALSVAYPEIKSRKSL